MPAYAMRSVRAIIKNSEISYTRAVPVWETIRIDIPLQELAYMGSLPPEKWAGMSDERIGRLVRAVENAVRKAVTLKEKMNGDNTHSGG